MVKDMSEPRYLVDTSLGLFHLLWMQLCFVHLHPCRKQVGRVGMKGMVCLCLDVLSTTEQLSGLSCCDVCALNVGGNLLRGEKVLHILCIPSHKSPPCLHHRRYEHFRSGSVKHLTCAM